MDRRRWPERRRASQIWIHLSEGGAKGTAALRNLLSVLAAYRWPALKDLERFLRLSSHLYAASVIEKCPALGSLAGAYKWKSFLSSDRSRMWGNQLDPLEMSMYEERCGSPFRTACTFVWDFEREDPSSISHSCLMLSLENLNECLQKYLENGLFADSSSFLGIFLSPQIDHSKILSILHLHPFP